MEEEKVTKQEFYEQLLAEAYRTSSALRIANVALVVAVTALIAAVAIIVGIVFL